MLIAIQIRLCMYVDEELKLNTGQTTCSSSSSFVMMDDDNGVLIGSQSRLK